MTARGFAERLIDHAAAVMPESRREWAAAMQAEFAALPDGRERLAWAVGCVWASYCERIEVMQVFQKSLLRAAAEGLVVAAFILGSMHLPASWGGNYVVGLVITLLGFYGGMFATLWALELAIARFWKVSGKPFQKTLLRTAVLWLWPVGWEASVFVGAWRATLGYPNVHVDFTGFMLRILIDRAGYLSAYFVAIFVPLLLCELLIAQFRRVRVAA
jgi:hypothetical protein